MSAKKTETAETAEARHFSLAKLRESSKEIYGISTATFDGAVFGLDSDKEYTVEEVRETIEKWLKKGVK